MVTTILSRDIARHTHITYYLSLCDKQPTNNPAKAYTTFLKVPDEFMIEITRLCGTFTKHVIQFYDIWHCI